MLARRMQSARQAQEPEESGSELRESRVSKRFSSRRTSRSSLGRLRGTNVCRRNLRPQDDRGATLIITALLMVALILIVAIVIDLGATRSDRRGIQAAVDNATAAAGQSLTPSTRSEEPTSELQSLMRI